MVKSVDKINLSVEEAISNMDIFKDVSTNTIKEAAKVADIICLRKNARLYSDKQELNYVYFVKEGRVSISKYSENGDNKVIFILDKNALINQPIMRKNTSAVECWAFENTEILRIPFNEFDKLMEKDYKLAKNCMIYMENRIRRLYRQLKNSVSINIEKKLAAKLFRLGTIYGDGPNKDLIEKQLNSNKLNEPYNFIEAQETFDYDLEDDFTKLNIDITITKIAKMLGCQRETVSRAMRELSKKGLVRTSSREIWINLKKLHEFFKS